MDKINIQYGYSYTRPEQIGRIWMPPLKWHERLRRSSIELWDEVIFPAALWSAYVTCLVMSQ